MLQFKKLLSMFLAVLMLVSVLPLTVIAEDIQNVALTHTISFKLNYKDAHKIPSQTVADGECAVEPDNATRTGWILDYWYRKTDDGIEKYDFSEPVTEDMTLYARWDEDIRYWGPIWSRNIVESIERAEKKVTVTIGQPAQDNLSKELWEKVQMPDLSDIETGTRIGDIAKPSLEGYTFEGWFYDKKLTEKASEDAPVVEDMTLYPSFVKNEDPDEPVEPEEPGVSEYFDVTIGRPMTVPEEEWADLPAMTVASGALISALEGPVMDNYYFVGWYYDNTLTEEVSGTDTLTSHVTLYPYMKSYTSADAPSAPDETPNETVGSLDYFTVLGADTDEKITIAVPETMTEEDIRANLSFIAVHRNNADQPYALHDNGDGTWTILPEDGLQPGGTYQMTALDREEVLSEDETGTVLKNEEHYIRFVYGGETKPSDVRYYNITVYRDKVNNLRIDSSVVYIPTVYVPGFDFENAELMTFAMTDMEGGGTASRNKNIGMFTYTGDKNLTVGDKAAIYSGNLLEDGSVTGDVAYVEILAVNGNVYTYGVPEIQDIIFIPEVFPIPASADQDEDETTITVYDTYLDITYLKEELEKVLGEEQFTEEELARLEEKEQAVDVGDFIAVFDAETLDENTHLTFWKITGIQSEDGTSVLTVEASDEEKFRTSANTFYSSPVVIETDEEAEAAMEAEMVRQAEESGFAEQAATYLAGMVLTGEDADAPDGDYMLDGIKVTTEDGAELTLAEARALYAGSSDDASTFVQIKINHLTAGINNNIVKIKDTFSSGKRAELALSVRVQIAYSYGGAFGNMPDQFLNFDIDAVFVQELGLKTNFSVDFDWGNKWYNFFILYNIYVNADIEFGSYTGASAVIKADSSAQDTMVDFILGGASEALGAVEDLAGGAGVGDTAYDTITDILGSDPATFRVNVQEKLDRMISDSDKGFFDQRVDGNTLVSTYQQMLKNEVGFVDLLRVDILNFDTHVDPLHLIKVMIMCQFVVSAKVNIIMGMTLEHLDVKKYSYSVELFDGDVSSKETKLQTPFTNFDFYVMGNLNIRAGIRATIRFAMITEKISNVGLFVEAGVYADMNGFFFYKYRMYNGKKTESKGYGAVYTAIGVYLNINIFFGIFDNLLSHSETIVDEQFEIWNSGDTARVYAAYRANSTKDIYNETTTYDLRSSNATKMKVVSAKTGYVNSYSSTNIKDFAVVLSGTDKDKFSYDKETGIITVHPGENDTNLSVRVDLTYAKDLLFGTEPIKTRLTLNWTKTAPTQRVYYTYVANLQMHPTSYTEIGYSVYHSKEFIEGQILPALPEQEVPEMPVGYAFGGWCVYCDALPEVNGKMLDEVGYLKGYAMPNTFIEMRPVLIPQPVNLTVNHWVETVGSGDTVITEIKDGYIDGDLVPINVRTNVEYELQKTEVVQQTCGYLSGAESFIKFADVNNGFTLDRDKLPVRDEWVIDIGVLKGYTHRVYGMQVLNTGESVLDLYYTRNSYYGVFDANNRLYTEYTGEPSAVAGIYEYDEDITEITSKIENAQIPGYEFKGWATERDGKAVYTTLTNMPMAEGSALELQTYYAVWEELPVENIVIYFYVQSPDGSYPSEPTFTHQADPIDVGISISDLWLALPEVRKAASQYGFGYTINTDDSKSGSRVELDTKEIHCYLNCDYTKLLWGVPGQDYIIEYYLYGDTVTFPTETTHSELTKPGYTISHWESSIYGDETEYPDGYTFTLENTFGFDCVLYTPVYVPAEGGVSYTVKHILEDAYGEYTEVEETETIKAQADSEVTPAVKKYTGFTSPEARTVTVNGDGSTVVEYRYARNTYTITLSGNGLVIRGQYSPITYKYGVPFYMDLNDLSIGNSGFTLKGWYLKSDETRTLFEDFSEISDEAVLTSEEDLVLVPMLEYSVSYYLEQLDGSYALRETVTGNASIGDTITAEEKSYTGFTLNEDHADTLASTEFTVEGGSSALKLYYARNRYTITWMNGDEKLGSEEYMYGVTPAYTGETPVKAADAQYTYTFTGWTPAITTVDGDKTYTADYSKTPIKYTITFDTDGGSAVDSITQDYGTAVEAPAAPTKTGHTFAGWDKAIPETMPAENVTITAQWTINQYTITFDTDGGSAVDSITQDYGTAVEAPAAPAKTGYTFAGWKTEDDADFTFSGYTMGAEDITLTAKWNPAEGTFYTVNHHFQNIENDEYTSETESKSGVTNAATTAEARNVPGFTAGEFSQKTINADGTTVIDIYYTRNSYTLTFMPENGTADIVFEGVKYGASITAPAAPTKTGHTFAGWDKAIPETMPAEDVIITAGWTINKYTLTLDFNGESLKQAVNVGVYQYELTHYDVADMEFTIEYGTALDELENVMLEVVDQPAHDEWNEELGEWVEVEATYKTVSFKDAFTGYTFKGWYASDDTAYTGESTMPADNLTLTAEWTGVPVTVKVYSGVIGANGVCEDFYDVTCSYGDSVPVPTMEEFAEKGFVNEGYVIVGWKFGDSSAGVGQGCDFDHELILVDSLYVKDSDSVYAPSTSVIEIYPCWFKEYNQIKITFHSNNDQEIATKVQMGVVGHYTFLQKNTFVNGNMEFAGWNIKAIPDEGTRNYIDGECIVFTKDDVEWSDEYGYYLLDLYAQWKDPNAEEPAN